MQIMARIVHKLWARHLCVRALFVAVRTCIPSYPKDLCVFRPSVLFINPPRFLVIAVTSPLSIWSSPMFGWPQRPSSQPWSISDNYYQSPSSSALISIRRPRLRRSLHGPSARHDSYPSRSGMICSPDYTCHSFTVRILSNVFLCLRWQMICFFFVSAEMLSSLLSPRMYKFDWSAGSKIAAALVFFVVAVLEARTNCCR